MIRSNLLAVLALTIGCRVIPETKTDDVGQNLEDTAQTDTAEDTDETGVVDTDTASEDTAVEDSGDTDTAVEPLCDFEMVAPGNGRVTIHNELQFTLSSASPSGDRLPLHFGCIYSKNFRPVSLLFYTHLERAFAVKMFKLW